VCVYVQSMFVNCSIMCVCVCVAMHIVANSVLWSITVKQERMSEHMVQETGPSNDIHLLC